MRDGLPTWAWWVISALGAVITEYTLWLNVADALDRRRAARAAGPGAGGADGGSCGHAGCPVCDGSRVAGGGG